MADEMDSLCRGAREHRVWPLWCANQFARPFAELEAAFGGEVPDQAAASSRCPSWLTVQHAHGLHEVQQHAHVALGDCEASILLPLPTIQLQLLTGNAAVWV